MLAADVWPVVLERLVSVGKRGMRPVSLVVLHGDAPADQVADIARDSDTVGRIASGGLVVVCPDTAPPGAREFATRLLGMAPTARVGVASLPMAAMTADELLSAASEAAALAAPGTVAVAPGLD